MSQGTKWVDAFATTGRLLGMTSGDIAAALPEGAPPPRWLEALDRATSRESRAAVLAAEVAKIRAAIRTTRPGWR